MLCVAVIFDWQKKEVQSVDRNNIIMVFSSKKKRTELKKVGTSAGYEWITTNEHAVHVVVACGLSELEKLEQLNSMLIRFCRS